MGRIEQMLEMKWNEFPSYKGGDTHVGRQGYILEYFPSHHLANSWGWVAQHRMIAEDKIGRRLVQDTDPRVAECAHHKDECKTNNHPDNIEVMTMSQHRSLHARAHALTTKHRFDRDKIESLLQIMTLKGLARYLGVHHQTIRNHFPDLVKAVARQSPVDIDNPIQIERVRVAAADPDVGLRDAVKRLGFSINGIRAICEKHGILWVDKTRIGRPLPRKQPNHRKIAKEKALAERCELWTAPAGKDYPWHPGWQERQFYRDEPAKPLKRDEDPQES